MTARQKDHIVKLKSPRNTAKDGKHPNMTSNVSPRKSPRTSTAQLSSSKRKKVPDEEINQGGMKTQPPNEQVTRSTPKTRSQKTAVNDTAPQETEAKQKRGRPSVAGAKTPTKEDKATSPKESKEPKESKSKQPASSMPMSKLRRSSRRQNSTPADESIPTVPTNRQEEDSLINAAGRNRLNAKQSIKEHINDAPSPRLPTRLRSKQTTKSEKLPEASNTVDSPTKRTRRSAVSKPEEDVLSSPPSKRSSPIPTRRSLRFNHTSIVDKNTSVSDQNLCQTRKRRNLNDDELPRAKLMKNESNLKTSEPSPIKQRGKTKMSEAVDSDVRDEETELLNESGGVSEIRAIEGPQLELTLNEENNNNPRTMEEASELEIIKGVVATDETGIDISSNLETPEALMLHEATEIQEEVEFIEQTPLGEDLKHIEEVQGYEEVQQIEEIHGDGRLATDQAVEEDKMIEPIEVVDEEKTVLSQEVNVLPESVNMEEILPGQSKELVSKIIEDHIQEDAQEDVPKSSKKDECETAVSEDLGSSICRHDKNSQFSKMNVIRLKVQTIVEQTKVLRQATRASIKLERTGISTIERVAVPKDNAEPRTEAIVAEEAKRLDKEHRSQDKANVLEKEARPKRPKFEEVTECIICCDVNLVACNEKARRCICKSIGKKCSQQTCLNRAMHYECPRKCGNGENCKNRRFQNKEYAKLEVFETTMKGLGLRALESITEGSFLIEYIGEIIDHNKFRKRSNRYGKNPEHTHHYVMTLDTNTYIDATKRGNVARYINHSCDPNAETEKWTVDRRNRIGFFALRDISAGEEITFDYRFERFGKTAQKCYCGSENCRGIIGIESEMQCQRGDEGGTESEFSTDSSDQSSDDENGAENTTKTPVRKRQKLINNLKMEVDAVANPVKVEHSPEKVEVNINGPKLEAEKRMESTADTEPKWVYRIPRKRKSSEQSTRQRTPERHGHPDRYTSSERRHDDMHNRSERYGYQDVKHRRFEKHYDDRHLNSIRTSTLVSVSELPITTHRKSRFDSISERVSHPSLPPPVLLKEFPPIRTSNTSCSNTCSSSSTPTQQSFTPNETEGTSSAPSTSNASTGNERTTSLSKEGTSSQTSVQEKQISMEDRIAAFKKTADNLLMSRPNKNQPVPKRVYHAYSGTRSENNSMSVPMPFPILPVPMPNFALPPPSFIPIPYFVAMSQVQAEDLSSCIVPPPPPPE